MAETELHIRKAVRGFVVTDHVTGSGLVCKELAFDRIEDVAAWLVERWAVDVDPLPEKSPCIQYDECTPPKGGRG